MLFNSLKEKCNYYRDLTDYKLIPNAYMIAMIDGKSFSKNVKTKFDKPFDDVFINMMNETAIFVSKNIQCCKFAFTQSDEISFIFSDINEGGIPYNYRLCKLQSIIASYATSIFNKLYIKYLCENTPADKIIGVIEKYKPLQFDCKVWNVPNYNDARSWIQYRQIDCIRNSKEQTAQTYIPHKRLEKINCDEQIKIAKDECGIDWNNFDNGKKYGRMIYPQIVDLIGTTGEKYQRTKWIINSDLVLTNENDRIIFDELNLF